MRRAPRKLAVCDFILYARQTICVKSTRASRLRLVIALPLQKPNRISISEDSRKPQLPLPRDEWGKEDIAHDRERGELRTRYGNAKRARLRFRCV